MAILKDLRIDNLWREIRKDKKLMDEAILRLMANPETPPEMLEQARAMYIEQCKFIAELEHVQHVGKQPKGE